ncbi:MAG: U32 family peptidase [Lachnospiraceae bacterium]|nr:U32 family peptidase [Lachnospiraceae bacterium]
MKHTEILAPAGSIASLKGAVAAGADAVYIGGGKFGARAYADNPDEEDLLSAIDFIHLNGKKIYLTVNTLLKEKELEHSLFDYLKSYYERGLDAVIVQDFGVLSFIRRNFPELPIHASTQMTICQGAGASLLERIGGITRVVPARELSISEIRQLREETKLELECFVHGALCYSYSGQCLLSSMIGGRSGNRGRCAQPCRQRYELIENDKTVKEGCLMSLKDICTLDGIPDLIDAGIDSFKIEGRMKKPEYTAGITSAYAFLTRKYEELGKTGYEKYMKEHPEELSERIREASEIYNRGGFTKGYYFNYHGPAMMTPDRANHSGVEVGKVSDVSGRHVSIRLELDVDAGDVLEIRGADKFEFTVGAAGMERLSQGKIKIYEVNVPPAFKTSRGTPVFRTRDQKLLDRIADDFLSDDAKAGCIGKMKASVGEKAELLVKIFGFEFKAEGDQVDEAKSRPMTAEDIKAVLNKTGESEFSFDCIEVNVKGNVFLPVGKIKELRRAAFEGLKNVLLMSERRTAVVEKPFDKERFSYAFKDRTDSKTKETKVICKVSDEDQLREVLRDSVTDTVFLDLQELPLKQQSEKIKEVKEAGKKAYACLPPIFRKKERERYEREFDLSVPDGVVINSLDEAEFILKSGYTGKIVCSEALYTMNDEAVAFLDDLLHPESFTASRELNANELKDVDCTLRNFTVYGRSPVMYSAQCLRDNFLTCLKKSKGEKKSIALKDKTGVSFPVKTLCPSCLNVIYNSSIYSMIGMREMEEMTDFKAHILSFTTETAEETARVLEAYKNNTALKGNYTRGHIRRGVE